MISRLLHLKCPLLVSPIGMGALPATHQYYYQWFCKHNKLKIARSERKNKIVGMEHVCMQLVYQACTIECDHPHELVSKIYCMAL